MQTGLGLGINRGGGGFSLSSLFGPSDRGFILNFTDISTLAQNAAGTVPLTSPNQSILFARDLGPRQNNFTQSTLSSAPYYDTVTGLAGAVFDGVDDFLESTSTVDYTGTTFITTMVLVRKASDALIGSIVAHGSPSTTAGSHDLRGPGIDATANYRAVASGATTQSIATTPATFAAVNTHLVMAEYDLAANRVRIYADGVLQATSTTAMGGGNFANLKAFIGRRLGATTPFSGTVAKVFEIGRQLNAGEIAAAEADMRRVDFNVASLFGATGRGIFADFTDIRTLFQDAAATVPVTGSTQSIMYARDLGPRQNHLIQSTLASAPSYNTGGGLIGALMDGVDDFLKTTSAVDLSASQFVTVMALVRRLDSASAGSIASVGSPASVAGSIDLLGPATAGNDNYRASARGASAQSFATTPSAYGNNVNHLLMAEYDLATNNVRIYVDSVLQATSITAMGGGNFANLEFFLGRRLGTTAPFSGKISRFVLIDRQLTAAEINSTALVIGRL